MENERLWLILLTAVSVLVCLFLTAANLHFLRLGWVFRDRVWMKARWNKEELFFIGLFTTIFLAVRPLHLIKARRLRGRFDTEDDLPLAICWTVLTMVVTTSVLGTVFIGCARVWNQYYQSVLAMRVRLASWRSLIDDSLVTREMSWFIRNQDTLGNRLFINKLTTVVLCVITLLNTFTHTVFQFPMAVATMAIGMVCCSFCMIIAYLYPAFQDLIHLRKERVVITTLLFGILAGWVVIVLFPGLCGWTWQRNYQSMFLLMFFRQMYIGCAVPIVNFVYFPYVISHFERHTRSFSVCGVSLPWDFDRSQTSSGRMRLPPRLSRSPGSIELSASSQPGSKSMDSLLRLSDVLGHNEWFALFVSHCVAEFSLENLLCVIELSKFRRRLAELYELGRKEGTDEQSAQRNEDDPEPAAVSSKKSSFLFRSPSSSIASLSLSRRQGGRGHSGCSHVPRLCPHIEAAKSSIVSRLQSKSDILSVARLLCDKYVSQGSTFCVNLSYYSRVELLRSIDDACAKVASVRDDQADEQVTRMIRLDLFDDVMKHCISLLKDSFSGFLFTEDCIRHLSIRKSSNRSLSQHNRL